MEHEAIICCFFDQEDRDCIGVNILFTLFHSDLCGELSQDSSAECGMLEANRSGKVVVKRLK
jgi:hypothetical protein